MVFEFNNEEIVEHCPVETWHSGKHILSLYYPIEKVVANYTNTFNVYLWMENGSGTVDVGDCIASVSGQAMAAGEAWDGKLEVEDYTMRFAIGGGLDVNGFRESLSMQMKETVNREMCRRDRLICSRSPIRWRLCAFWANENQMPR